MDEAKLFAQHSSARVAVPERAALCEKTPTCPTDHRRTTKLKWSGASSANEHDRSISPEPLLNPDLIRMFFLSV